MTSTHNNNPIQRARGALLGLAVGDAIGTTVEFKPRGSFEPLTDMVGGGPFRLAPGQFTDDTSMALCLGASLIEKGFDLHDQMTRYTRWANEGYMSSNGRCFDIGIATRAALQRFQRNANPLAGSTDPHSAGNGCIMRLAPVPIRYPCGLESCQGCCGAVAVDRPLEDFPGLCGGENHPPIAAVAPAGPNRIGRLTAVSRLNLLSHPEHRT